MRHKDFGKHDSYMSHGEPRKHKVNTRQYHNGKRNGVTRHGKSRKPNKATR